jgi:CDP-glycerol glycerophosphotransferase
MAELLAVSDVLISDYSGSLYDFPLTNRPCFIYASDYEEYKLERDLEFDLNKVPYPLSCNNQDLQNNITNFDHNKYLCQLSEFHKVLGDQAEGTASKQIVSWISSHLK